MSQLSKNTTDLQTILNKVRALPDADSGSGGGSEDLNEVLTEQEALIAELQDTLRGKAAGGGGDGDTGYEEGYHDGIISMFETVPSVLTASDLRGATKVRQYCFYSNDVITSVELPDTVTVIEDHAFYQCPALTSFKLSSNLVELGTHALSRCYYIDWGNLVLPRTLQKIGDYAFWHCRSLPQVTIPESVTEIGLQAFNNGYTETVIMESVTPPTVGSTPFTQSRLKRILVKRAAVDAYKAATNWSDYGDKIFAAEDYPEITGG